jgi:hypothetical protein
MERGIGLHLDYTCRDLYDAQTPRIELGAPAERFGSAARRSTAASRRRLAGRVSVVAQLASEAITIQRRRRLLICYVGSNAAVMRIGVQRNR